MAGRSSRAAWRSRWWAARSFIATRSGAAAFSASRAALLRVCKRLDGRGLVAGAEGNVSVRLGARLLITPGGARKGELRSSDLVEVELASGQWRGKRAPSSEIEMHFAIYRARPDVSAIVHAHPPTATGFAVARKPMPVASLAEMVGVIGPVPLVEYRRPGTAALGAVVASALASADAALLANHGAVTVARDLDQALNLMESLEQAARILVSAHILGGGIELSRQEVLDLEQGRRRAGDKTDR